MSPHNRLPAIARPLGWLAFSALVLSASMPKASTVVFMWPWAFYAQLLILVPVGLLAGAILRRTCGLGSAVWSALGLALVIGLSVLHSRQPHFSFEAALPLWGALAWGCWLARGGALPREDGAPLLDFARIAGVAMAIPLCISLALYARELLVLVRETGTWRFSLTDHRNWYPLGHWNYTGALALLTAPWFMALAWHDRRGWRALWLAAGSAAVLVFITASSRGAMLGVFAGGAAAGVLWLSAHRPSRRQLIVGITLVVALGGLLIASNPRTRRLVLHPTEMTTPSEGDVQRLGMAQAGWLLFRHQPWLGHGPGMVSFVYPEVRAQVVGGVETSYQLHNGPLHWLATTGTVGGIAAGVLLAVLATAAWGWRRQPVGLRRSLMLASAGALAAYAGLALTDYQLDVIAILALLGLHGAMLLAPESGHPEPRRRGPALAAGLALAVGGAGALLVLAPHWWARFHYWSALAETPAGQPEQLARRMFGAVAAAPWNTHYRNQIGFQLALAAGSPDADPALRDAARRMLASSAGIDPAQEPVHATLGWLWLPDSPAQARFHFEAAAQLLPDRPYTFLGLALARLGCSDRSGAVHALGMELLVDPAFIASPYWRQEPFASLRGEVLGRGDALLLKTLADPRLPRWRRPALLYQHALHRWWSGGARPSAQELEGASAHQRAFFSVAELPLHDAANLPPPWAELDAPAGATKNAASQPVAEPVLRAVELRCAQTGSDTLAGMLRAPIPDQTPVAHTQLFRGHYPLMHRNIDGPGYADLAPYLEDPFFARYGAPLFPLRGIVPGPILIDLAAWRPGTAGQ